jgi:hypothetical protein
VPLSRGIRERETHYPARVRSCRKNTHFGTPSEKDDGASNEKRGSEQSARDVKGFALYRFQDYFLKSKVQTFQLGGLGLSPVSWAHCPAQSASIEIIE